MEVLKRDGRRVPVHYDSITRRIQRLSDGLSVDPAKIAQLTIAAMYDGVKTSELDTIAANKAEEMKLSVHPDYAILASRILISNLHKNTLNKFSECMEELNRREPKRIQPKFMKYIRDNAAALDSMIVSERDYDFDYVGVVTMLRIYLHSSNGVVIDRPQYMFMRVAIQVGDTLEWVQRIYERVSKHEYTHATPTLMNSCMNSGQLSSCFLLGTSDSQRGILSTMNDAAVISKHGGGVAIHVSNIRAAGQKIESTGGRAAGLVPQLRVYNNHARLWDQGGNKRLAAYAFYCEPHHPDILQFLQLLLPQGSHHERAHDINIALWIPDLFIHCLLAEQKFSLFSEDTAPYLSDVYDGMEICTVCEFCYNSAWDRVRAHMYPQDESAPVKQCTVHQFSRRNVYTELYTHYESKGLAVRTIDPREIIAAITESKEKTGKPYICFKDHVNRQSNQQPFGTIKSSNLCTEIMEVSDGDAYAVCTLASVNLTHFVTDNSVFDFDALGNTVRDIVRALDNVTSLSAYPVEKCTKNTEQYRPIGIGVQGLANVFCMMRLPFCGKAATCLDMQIMETIYYNALVASCDLARERGPHARYEQTPAYHGILRQDLWKRGNFDTDPLSYKILDERRWDELRAKIREFGLRCSLHVALMPTASTSLLFGNNESFEPYRAHIGTNTGVTGRLTIANMTMVRHLMELGLWNDKVRTHVISTGTLPKDAGIPDDVLEIYEVVWNMKQRYIQRRASLRSMFVDQSQSLNLYVSNVTAANESTLLVNGWKAGLMTCSYYTHSKAAVTARKNRGIDTNAVNNTTQKSEGDDAEVCRVGCTNCSS